MKKNSFQFKISIVLAIFLFLAVFNISQASFNEQINFQGKLTNSSNLTVADGDYNMEFKLYATSSGGVALWTETATATKISVTSGLFSHLLGSISSLSGVDFNQTLWLGVTIGGSGETPEWDSEMTPRKKLGAVPAAFEAKKLGGKLESAFATLAENETVTGAWDFNNILTIASSTASTTLTVTQSGNGNIVDLKNATSSVFTIASDGTVTATGNMIISGTATTTNLVVTTDSKLGTVSGGTWEGTPIGILYGGTGTTTAAGARTNLGLAIDTDVQAYNAGLQSISGLTTGANQMIYLTGSNTYSTTTLTAFARTILDDGDAGTMRTTIELGNVENTALSTWLGSTNITTLGTIATGTWQGTTIAPGFGGTGLTSYSEGDIIYATAATTLNKLIIGAANTVLTSSGSAPQWSTSLNLAGTLNVTGTTTIGSFVMSSGASSTYVLTSDVNGVGTWQEATGGGGDVGGSGAANYIARWTDASTLTTSTIFEDSGKIGIATTSPAYTLDVYGTLGVSGTSSLNVIDSGTWQGTTITPGFGGTGLTSYSVGDLIYASGATTLSKLAGVALGNALISGGVGTAPSWSKIGLTTHVSGTLPVGSGGTGLTSLATGRIPFGAGTDPFASTSDFWWEASTSRMIIGTSTAPSPDYWDPPMQKGLVVYGDIAYSGSLLAFSPIKISGGIILKDGDLVIEQGSIVTPQGNLGQMVQELDINLYSIASLEDPEEDSFAEQFFSNLFSRIRSWLADATNGIKSIFVSEKICIDGECLTADDIRLLKLQNTNYESQNSGHFSSDSDEAEQTNEELIKEPVAEEKSGSEVSEEPIVEEEQIIEQEQIIEENQTVEEFETEEPVEESGQELISGEEPSEAID